jgi:hypothetical protein
VEPLLWFTKQSQLQEQPKILCLQKYNDLENVAATLIEANKKMKLLP